MASSVTTGSILNRNAPNLWDPFAFGTPLEEWVWALIYGAVCPIAFAFFLKAKLAQAAAMIKVTPKAMESA